MKLSEATQMFVMGDYERATTVKKSCIANMDRLCICSFCFCFSSFSFQINFGLTSAFTQRLFFVLFFSIWCDVKHHSAVQSGTSLSDLDPHLRSQFVQKENVQGLFLDIFSVDFD